MVNPGLPAQQTPTDPGTATDGGTATGSGAPGATPDSPVPFELFPEWVPEWVLNAGAAVVVLVLAYVVSKAIVYLFGRRIARRFERPSITRTVLRGITVVVYLVALLTILRIYGLGLGNIGLSIAVLSAVVGVILAPIVGSYVSGMFLLADQPYEIGDMIEIVETGERGFVEDITLRYTKVFTLDNTFLVIPNGTMRDRDILNYSAEDPRTRLALDVVVTYESDLAAARELIEKAAREVDIVIGGGPSIRVGAARYPAAPTCYIEQFGDHGVHLRLRYWIKEPYKLLATRSAVQTAVWEALEDVDVEIAYPHTHHVFDDTSGELRIGATESGDVGSSRASRIDRATAGEPPDSDELSDADESGGTEDPSDAGE